MIKNSTKGEKEKGSFKDFIQQKKLCMILKQTSVMTYIL